MTPSTLLSFLKRKLKRKRISNEAYEWFSVLYSGDLNENDFLNYMDWAELHPDEARQVEALEKTWKKIPAFNEPVSNQQSLTDTIRLFLKPLSLAAGSIAIIVTAAIIYFSGLAELQQSDITYETARAETTTVNLPDGSIANLNVLSSFKIDFTENERRVQLLKGEVSFKVSHDKTRPFIVSTNDSQVVALGTEFNTKLSADDNYSVTLLEGSISVSRNISGRNPEETILDIPGLQANINFDNSVSRQRSIQNLGPQQTIQVASVDIDEVISWRQGKIIFNGENLSQAIEIINSHTTHNIQLQATELSDSPIFGVFNSGDWEGFLSAIETSYPLHHFSAGQNLTILSVL